MVVIIFEDFSQEFVLAVMDGLDDVFVIAGEIEKGATLAGRTKLGEDVFRGQRNQILGRIQTERGAEMPKNPRRIILELEIVFGAGRQFAARDIKAVLVFGVKVGRGEFAIQFGIRATDTTSDPGEHIIRPDEILMVLVDLRSDHDALVVRVGARSFRGTFGADMLRPPCGVFILW